MTRDRIDLTEFREACERVLRRDPLSATTPGLRISQAELLALVEAVEAARAYLFETDIRTRELHSQRLAAALCRFDFGGMA